MCRLCEMIMLNRGWLAQHSGGVYRVRGCPVPTAGSFGLIPASSIQPAFLLFFSDLCLLVDHVDETVASKGIQPP